jgi:hypothetical protein
MRALLHCTYVGLRIARMLAVCTLRAIMENKGISYRIVRTASPTGFQRIVELDANRSRTGFSQSRGNAIFSAARAI